MEHFNNIVNCKLILQNGNIFILPVRKDGFIFGTVLSKSVGKNLGNWLRQKIKEVQKTIENKDNKKVIEIYKNGTWLNYELGLELADFYYPSLNISSQISIFFKNLNQESEKKIEEELDVKNNELENNKLEKNKIDVKKNDLEKKIDGELDIKNNNFKKQILINKELLEKIELLENKNKELLREIQFLENKFIRFQKREKCEDNNVIYLISNEDIKKERVYIFGKAIDIKIRLTTYNKSLEHEIVYYKSFKNMYQMKVAEMMVLYKLNKYIDKSKKERLILPKNEDISIFTKIIDEAYEWFKNIDNIIVDENFINKEKIILPNQQIKKGSFEKNTVYMLSSKIHLEKRTFIIGKSTNLNSRLSAYNKGLDHDVVYYKKCKNKYHMNTIELMILYKLDNFRERANRDRFILPNDKNIDLFTIIFDEAIKWFEDIDENLIIIKDAEFKKQDIKETTKNYRELNKEKVALMNKNYRENNKEELLKKAKNYRKENKEKVSDGKKKWYFKNKEKVIDRIKENYYKNKEQKIEKVKEYYNKNKEKVKERESIKITCECGSIFRKYGLQKHVKTEKHLKFIENNSKKSNDIL